ncbi:MAG: hypothetical protein QXX68_03395 [Candidatus Pacearchaeota archaeon]
MTNKLFFNFIKIKKNTPFLWVILFIFSSFNPYFFLSPEDFLTKKTARAELNPTGSEYFVNIGPVAGTATANYVYASIFNPSGSTKTVLIKRVLIRAFASAAANYVNLTLRRISAASGGTQILASEIPKKITILLILL